MSTILQLFKIGLWFIMKSFTMLLKHIFSWSYQSEIIELITYGDYVIIDAGNFKFNDPVDTKSTYINKKHNTSYIRLFKNKSIIDSNNDRQMDGQNTDGVLYIRDGHRIDNKHILSVNKDNIYYRHTKEFKEKFM